MALSKIASERLANELLLSKGGGIYYDAARVAADDSTATLFVGLGGTGADMLIRIKNEVKRRMVLPQADGKISGDTPANIGFIAFDTDRTTNDKTWGIASFDRYGREFCSLAVDNVPAVVENRCRLVDQGDPVWQWYEKIPADMAVDGANGRRQIGRLLLFENARKVYEKIQTRVNEIRMTGDGIKTVNVMLVTGISGGTGSGTFIDMAYLIRNALDGLSVENKQIFGFIVLPDVNLLKGGQKDRLSANAFASLKELDYWMCADEQEAVFEQNYGQDIFVRFQRRIFEFCHLLSAQDFGGNPLTYDKVINSMAEFVFAYTAGETGGQTGGNTAIQQMYNNISNYVDTISGKAAIPACYRYLAVGTHKLEIPYEEISTLLAVRLFERLGPVFALRPTEETFKADMTTLRLVPKKVIHDSLTEKLPASPISGNPQYQYSQIWGGNNDSYNRNTVYIDVMNWYAREFQTTVTKSAANYVNVQCGYFYDFIRDQMKKPDRGPQYLTALLKSDSKWSIIPTLEGIAEHCTEVAATCENKRGALEETLQREYNGGHGKILNKKKSIDCYLAALNDWIQNEAGIMAYGERARVVRQLRARFLQLYEKIFSKLFDVIEALPDIFRQNLDIISLAQKEATLANQLDDTKLIWPLTFEQENQQEFERLLGGACAEFLENMTTSLSKWVGCDLETIDEGSGGSTDVPGFISRFISEQFGSLLRINMEDIIRAKMGGADDMDDYLHGHLVRLRERSVPMFQIDAANRNLKLSEFAIVSVPEDCENIKSAVRRYYTDPGITQKMSREKTRLYYVKVVSGIPLFAYTKMKESARYYKSVMSIDKSRQGTHLDAKWADGFPTPYPESAWPSDYADEEIRRYNARIGESFDRCLAEGVIYLEQDGSVTRRYRLKIADPQKARLLDAQLTGSIEGRLAQLAEIKEALWGGEDKPLPQMGDVNQYSLEKITRESILRLPKLCALIGEQANLLEAVTKREREIADPRYFAYALLCGLVEKRGYELVLKRSIDSVIVEPLYDLTLEKDYAEYETYQAFRAFLDDKRRGEIDQFRTELLRRVAAGSPEKAECLERMKQVSAKYAPAIQDVRLRIDKANLDKRKGYQDILDFYMAVLSIAEKYRDEYLA
jgi:hypothetical protein